MDDGIAQIQAALRDLDAKPRPKREDYFKVYQVLFPYWQRRERDGASRRTIAKELGIDHRKVSRYIRRYETHLARVAKTPSTQQAAKQAPISAPISAPLPPKSGGKIHLKFPGGVELSVDDPSQAIQILQNFYRQQHPNTPR